MIARSLRMNNATKSNIIRLVSYLTDSQGHDQRVQGIHLTNCDSDTAEWAALEILTTQKQNTKAKGDKTYHLMLSFHEVPSLELLKKMEEQVCAKLGFEGHQRISVAHGDTENFHLHVAINKIHPTRLTIQEPYYDHTKLAEMCQELEQRYGLIPDNHVFQAAAKETAAKSMEMAGDLESLIGWVQRICLEKLKQASSWEDLHGILAANGLEIRLRGNGMVIVSDNLHVKASSVDRSLSKKRLEDRLGEFEPAQKIQPSAERKYVKHPMPLDGRNVDELWKKFREWRHSQDQDRNAALADIQRRREAELTTNSSDFQRAVTKHVVKGGVLKRVLYAMQRHQNHQRRKAILAKYSRERRELFRQKPNLTWRAWLEDEARAGNIAAWTAIRARDTRHADRSNGEIKIWATGDKAQKPFVIPTSAALTRKGTVIFPDGCRADGQALSCSSFNDAIRAVLEKAHTHYGSTPLHVKATSAQEWTLINAAVNAGIPVVFADPRLKAMHRRAQQKITTSQNRGAAHYAR